MPEPLRVQVLGPVRAWLGERELPLGTTRQRTVFAVLAAGAGRVISRDELVAGVWGATPPATAAGSVYTYVSGLRRALGPAASALVTRDTGYLLRVDPGGLDAVRFTELTAAAAARQGRGDPVGASGLLAEALRLWRGEAYAGLTGAGVENDRARLAGLRLAAVERRARIRVELDDDSLVAELAGLVRDHPLHEPLHELLMLALYRAGRGVEALEAYRSARRVLVAELGVEPGPALRDLHQRVLRGDPAATRPSPAPPVVPAGVARTIRDGGPALHGRAGELTALRTMVADVARGRGAAVSVEGAAGIGKTELLTAALVPDTHGAQLCWAAAGELDRDVPLQVLTRALGLDPASPDPRRAALAAALDAGDDGPARVLGYLRTACAAAPVVLVVDDFHLADDATRQLWDRLTAATQRMPLLLIAAARTGPGGGRGPDRPGRVLTLPPLSASDTERLVAAVVGAPLGPHLRAVVPSSGGNPLHARETAMALVRGGAVTVTGGVAEIDASVPVSAPESVLAAVRSTVEQLGGRTREVLRQAALLGTEFAVGDLAAVTGRQAYDLLADLEEALAASVLVAAGDDLAFRHPVLRQAIYESIPAADRPAQHRRTARALADTGRPVTRVAGQLIASGAVVDHWVAGWLAARHADVARRAPETAGTLIRQTLDAGLPTPAEREVLLIALVRGDFRYGRSPLAEAQQAYALATDPADRAEMRQALAALTFRAGRHDEAITLLATDDPATPEIWRTRHQVLRAHFRRGDVSDPVRAEEVAERVHAEAVAAGEPFEAAYALQTRWLVHTLRRDHGRALEFADRALDAVPPRRDYAGLYLDLLDNRMFTLQNLDRMDEAERTLREAALYAIRHRLTAGLPVASAVQSFWGGRWDDAMAEVGTVTEDAPGITFLGLREPGAMTMLLHGVAALIAARRGDAGLAAAHLDAAGPRPVTASERDSSDFLLVARALVAEQQGRNDDAFATLAPLLSRDYAPMMLRHQWLPDIVRFALRFGRADVAELAGAVCADEAAREVRPARAYAAAARCRALLDGDQVPALEAAAHYRRVGRPLEMASALEDAAVLRAGGPGTEAREAAEIYTQVGARWDLRRLHSRLGSATESSASCAAGR